MKPHMIFATWSVRRRATLVLLLLAAMMLSMGAVGQERVPSTPYTTLANADVNVNDGNLDLALEDAILISLRRNLGLQVQRYRRVQAAEGVGLQKGIFDLNLSADLNFADNSSPSASQLQGADVIESDSLNFDLGLSQLVGSGGTFSIDWTNNRQETNSIFSSINPSFSVGLAAVFSQPLLNGFGSAITKADIRVAANSSEISREILEQAIIAQVEQVENTYWALAESQSQLVVSLESLQLAKELHEMNSIQVEVGTLAPLELVQSEVGVATREEELLRAEVLAQDNADVLRQLLNLDNALWTTPIVPTTDPIGPRIEIDVDASIQAALDNRSEVRAQVLAINNLEIDSAVARNVLKPRLDWQVRYGYNGLGGDLTTGGTFFDPSPPMTLSGGYGDAAEQVLDGSFDSWSTGLVFGIPLQNRFAKGNKAIADLALQEGLTVLDDIRLQIVTDVRRTTRGVQTAAEAIDLADISTTLAIRQLEAEQKRYDNGLSTSFEVLEIQEDLTAARSRQVTTVAQYRRALVLFYKALGTLLPEKGVQLDDSGSE